MAPPTVSLSPGHPASDLNTVLRSILSTVVANPWVYDLVQKAAGREENYRRLKPLLAHAKGEVLLEAGAGTGEITRILDPTTRYLWLDNDTQKLSGFKQKNKGHWAVLADGTGIPLASRSVHSVLTLAVTHHLQDHDLDLFLAELARVCRHQLVFLDGLEDRSSMVSNLMWHYDRGSHPRTEQHLLSKLRQYFDLEEVQRYKIYHQYLLCTGTPRRLI
jgi:ubiquinone/menaquinone biosynthesis C-methylase UbiE